MQLGRYLPVFFTVVAGVGIGQYHQSHPICIFSN